MYTSNFENAFEILLCNFVESNSVLILVIEDPGYWSLDLNCDMQLYSCGVALSN
jgi:hypothetical protein